MIEFYAGNTPNNQRVAIMLEELGLPYRLHKIDIFKGGAKTPEFLRLNPDAQSPVIIDPDGPGQKPLTLTQSWLICLYLADKTKRFIPADELGRLRVLEVLFHVATDVGMVHTTHNTLTRFVPEKVPSTIAFYEERVLGALQSLDRRLQDAAYLAGDLSVADFTFYPIFNRRRTMIAGRSGYANLERWGRTMDAREACKRGLAVTE
jgi:GSH-dependent disulfide-bond oxidoreductase